MKPKHDCPCCTCGMIELEWSDRTRFVFNGDLEAIAEAIVCCLLDHSYDRVDDGPWGLSNGQRTAIRPVIERHMSAVDSDWRTKTIDMSPEQRNKFLNDLVAALKEVKDE